MTWTFSQSSGQIRNELGELVGAGYAGGACGARPEAVNNPAMQDIHGVGPLPRGVYTKGVAVEHSHLGAFAIPLIPDPMNEMFGRGSFYFHGDTKTPNCASEGCIVAAPSLRHEWYDSDDNEMMVIL
jgi:hypothetical protein